MITSISTSPGTTFRSIRSLPYGMEWGAEPLGYEAGDTNLRRYVGNGVLQDVDSFGLEITIKGTKPGEEEKINKLIGEISKSGTEIGEKVKAAIEDPKVSIEITVDKKNKPFPRGFQNASEPSTGVVLLPLLTRGYFEENAEIYRDNQVVVGDDEESLNNWRKVVIAHELAHAITGKQDLREDGSPDPEFFRWENELRLKLGLPPRTHYKLPGENGPGRPIRF